MLPPGNRRPGRPPAATADKTRQRILQAARLVFSERGYDGATFKAIATRVDLSRPAINHYFSSKRALYREAMDDTNEFVIGASIKQADGETGLVARLTAFVSAAVKADSENPTVSSFIIGGLLESQRHPEWNGTENDSIRIAREFLMRVVNDAIECGEVVADIDASVLVETLLVITSGVGLYAGYIESYEEMIAVTGMLRQLLESVLSRPEV
ncbi:TetR/AcrR family transcriptional regulator [Mycobacterium paraintracellulare]|uniref:TetR/AcrR family transcriptional regulator n=1 Tax=Mycobacterium paraintracellulare TaxID=1138383 RepID=UPI001916A6BA|nr:TetR/AcrR family transcriptional regulator [Mycobacterium paraintracellulare]